MLKDYEILRFSGQKQGFYNYVPIGNVDCITPPVPEVGPEIKSTLRTKSGANLHSLATPEELDALFREAIKRAH